MRALGPTGAVAGGQGLWEVDVSAADVGIQFAVKFPEIQAAR